MANAASKVRAVFMQNSTLTLTQIKTFVPDLEKNEISMALCYLMRQKYLTRKPVANKLEKQRKEVWEYTYHANKIA
jgi:hypothetical protein